jgi:hypothetical protein
LASEVTFLYVVVALLVSGGLDPSE